jgi:hypothetical protein
VGHRRECPRRATTARRPDAVSENTRPGRSGALPFKPSIVHHQERALDLRIPPTQEPLFFGGCDPRATGPRVRRRSARHLAQRTAHLALARNTRN